MDLGIWFVRPLSWTSSQEGTSLPGPGITKIQAGSIDRTGTCLVVVAAPFTNANQLDQKQMSSPSWTKFHVSHRVVLLAFAALIAARSGVAQPLRCTAIRPGDTATQVAKRITGEARSTRESWFQIIDPATSRVVPKASYDYVRAGWNACVVTETATVARESTPAPAGNSTRGNFALWAALLALVALATRGADDYFSHRAKAISAMRQFGQRFLQEFERPLIVPDISARPIQSRLRCIPRSARLDILIAPGIGHRYPNLTDHRHNVEYDLKRILHVLRDQPFINGPPYMNGSWVVLPFQLKPGITEAGGK